MSYQTYVDRDFSPANIRLIQLCDTIIADYMNQGFVLTVRQLYYQLVTQNVIANKESEYKRITNLVNDARMAGLLDWDGIEDRTRSVVRRSKWDSPKDILNSCASSYHEDVWSDQGYRVVVIVEKEALVGVLQPTCEGLDVPILAARGYPSGTVLREFCQQDILPAIRRTKSKGGMQRVIILHFGDHDPSGLDMTRDLRERLNILSEDEFDVDEIERIALNMDQVQKYKPPENPAKVTDSRFKSYMQEFGSKSWELDALKPSVLTKLVNDNVIRYMDVKKFNARCDEVKDKKDRLREMADEWVD